MMRVEARDALPDLPAQGFELGAAWFGAVAAAALPAGARAEFLTAVGADGAPRVVLPLQRHADGRREGLTAPYTTRFRPLAAADATAQELRAAGRAFARSCRTAGPLRLDALEEAWPGLAPLLAGFRDGGMWPVRFAHFGNWHLDVAGLGWDAYLAARPGALRNTIRRRLAQAARDPALGVAILGGGAELDAGIASYKAVYARSWKEPEPYPRFAAALMRAAAGVGALRLGLMRAAGDVIAAQLWVVADGVATVHKLAHDEQARALSPGTVLSARMIRHLLDEERVAMLDFGRGDDAYKAGWTGTRQQRIGVLLCPPWHIAGARALACHAAGRVRARLAARLKTA